MVANGLKRITANKAVRSINEMAKKLFLDKKLSTVNWTNRIIKCLVWYAALYAAVMWMMQQADRWIIEAKMENIT